MTTLVQANDIVSIYCETNSFRSLSEQFRKLLSEVFSVDVLIHIRLDKGCLVSCGREGCVYYSSSVVAPSGFALTCEISKDNCTVGYYTDAPVSSDFEEVASATANLLIKRVEDDDVSLEARLKAVVNVVGITFHDMRNILGSISGIVQLIELDLSEEDELISSIKEISSVVDRFELSSRNTMKLYRNEPIHYNTTSVDITTLYTKLLEKRARVFSLSGIALHTSVEDGLVGSLNEEYVGLFLNELLSNAFDSFEGQEAGGEIHVGVKREGDTCRIVVEDYGSGIPYDLQRHIFKLFVTTKNKRRGTGLSIIARTVSDWGGVVHFQSTPGKGSRFEVAFPFVL